MYPQRQRAAWRLGLPLLVMLGSALAFTLSDHGRKAFIRPAEKLFDVEAETAADPAVVRQADEDAANGEAVLLTPGGPPIRFRQSFDRGTYSVWCIGRSDQAPTAYREPMYVHLTVDGPDGRRQWRMRINYEHKRFQDVAHLYVDVNVPGDYAVAFGLGTGSRFNLIVDRLEVRDVLAGTWKKGFKTEPTLFTEAPPVNAGAPPYEREAALALGRKLAASLPPRNCIIAGGGMDTEGYYKELRLDIFKFAEPNAGRWTWTMNESLEEPWALSGPTVPSRDELDMILDEPGGNGAAKGLDRAEPVPTKTFGVPPKNWPDLNWGTAKPGPEATYTAEDYAAFKLAPSRWPDDGGGYFIPADMTGEGHNRYYNWMAGAFKQRFVAYRDAIVRQAEAYYRTGDRQAGFRAALMLAFWADHFPSIDYTVQSTMLTTWGSFPFNDFSGNRAGEFGKLDYSGWAGPNNVPAVLAYDQLFTIIAGNQLLADAVGQVIPWVKTPADVIELIDVKFIQHFYDVCNRGEVRFSVRCDPLVAIVQGNNEAGRTMLRAIAFESDFQHLSVMDELVCSRSRDSTSYIGSMFYAKAPSMIVGTSVVDISRFANRYQLPEFDLAKRHGTILYQVAQWLIEPFAAGVQLPGVGDVSGPEGYPCMEIGEPLEARRVLAGAWELYRDPRFAYMYGEVYGGQTDEAMREAIAGLGGDPRLNQPPRSLGGFGVTILEAHGADPDFRNRSGIVFRTGYGAGHSHNDQLNLEIFAKGLVMAPEFGGRGGYGEPGTGAPECHNLVTVDGRASDTGRTEFVAAIPGCPVTMGIGGQTRRLFGLVEAGTGDSFIVDFVRARGGTERTYWFHGQQSDSVDPDLVKSSTEKVDDPLDDLLGAIAEENKADKRWKYNPNIFSHSPPGEETLQAVWPLQRDMEERMWSRLQLYRAPGGTALPYRYDPKSPRKFTRLSLFGSGERQVKTVVATSRQVGYRITLLGASEKGEPAVDSLFAGVIDCFAGKPFIGASRAVAATPAGDGQPAAVRVSMEGGREDLFYQADDPAVERQAGELLAAGRFAWASRDEQGARALAVVEGTRAAGHGVALTLDRPAWQTTVAAVDFARRRVTLAEAVPPALVEGSYWRLGRDRELFRVRTVEAGEMGTVLVLDKTPETYRAQLQLLHDGREIVGAAEPEARQSSGWVTNETMTGGWPVESMQIGHFRWMGTSFRGGARMGCPLSWKEVPDTDGDGVKTLSFGPNDDWTEPMRVEVIQVVERLRAFVFRSLNSPAGYKGTRSFAGSQITSEAGQWLGVTVIPGKMGSFTVAAKGLTEAVDFPDADGDGLRNFHVYFFGPGDPAELTGFGAVTREANGTWLVTANVPATVSLPGAGALEISLDGQTWQPSPDGRVSTARAWLRRAPN